MVPHNSLPPSPGHRALTDATRDGLRVQIMRHWRAMDGSEPGLAEAILDAAREARERGLRPEELIVALKEIADEVAGTPDALRASDVDARRRFREWLVTSCVKAWFQR